MHKKLIQKQIGVLLLTMVLFLHGTAMPVQADEAQNVLNNIHKWALSDLVEGKNYGIFSKTWYQEGFQKQIPVEKLQTLLQATERKIAALGLEKKEGQFVPSVQGNTTRGAFIKNLYHILAQYKWPTTVVIDNYKDITYLHQKGIVKGTGNGLELEEPCSIEEAVVMATRLVTDVYATLEEGGKGFLWKLSHHNHTMYLLGSIHFGITDFYPLHPKVKEAFDQADELIVEANINVHDQAEVARLMEQLMYHDGTTLKDHVSKDTYEKAQQVFAKYKLPEKKMNLICPWALSQSLSSISDATEAGTLNVAAGIDPYFTSKANITEKPIKQLESVEFQGKLFSNFPAESQEKQLNQVLDQILATSSAEKHNSELERLKLLQQQWVAGDVESFTNSLQEATRADGEAVTQKMFGERDKNMADQLAHLLQQEGQATYFVVVGAGHLVLKDTIIDQLKAKGFTIQRVKL